VVDNGGQCEAAREKRKINHKVSELSGPLFKRRSDRRTVSSVVYESGRERGRGMETGRDDDDDGSLIDCVCVCGRELRECP
jgi:hypothetical protein